ncbi:MAG: DUF4403 family protein [Fulvivirga sp.]|uniref:DUF4403 family protein n=1 Tax=Fulvivirga sp. TaxID=1931237 RepID=UPI0032EBBDD5
MDRLLATVFITLLFSCSRSSETLVENTRNMPDYEAKNHNLLDQSTLQFPLDYPVSDLQKMINRILPDTLVNDSIDLNDKGDFLVLKVLPIGDMLLNSYQNKLDASLPVKALAYVKKKVALFNIKNKKPIELKLRLDLHTILAIDENFDLNTRCTIQQIRWIEEPNMRVAGLKINLKNIIDKQIEQNKLTIENAICAAINETVPMKKEVIAIWNLLNQTHRVATRPVDIWLTAIPEDFSANFDDQIKDTLRVVLYAKAGVLISPLKGIQLKEIPDLPINKRIKTNDQLDLRVSVNMPYEYMNLIMDDLLKGQEFEYSGWSTQLTGFNTYGERNRLTLKFKTQGDVELDLEARAKPAFSINSELMFNELEYEIASDNPLVNSIDWITSSSVDNYLKQNSKVPLGAILDSLDSKIVYALDRSKLSSKIDLRLKFDKIQSDTIIYYNDRFEWIFSVKGTSHALLNDSLVVRKN